jgi:hypothetical protein
VFRSSIRIQQFLSDSDSDLIGSFELDKKSKTETLWYLIGDDNSGIESGASADDDYELQFRSLSPKAEEEVSASASFVSVSIDVVAEMEIGEATADLLDEAGSCSKGAPYQSTVVTVIDSTRRSSRARGRR